MKTIKHIFALIALCVAVGCSSPTTHQGTLFVWGSDINLKFTQYVAELTQKENPHILYLPTASGDNQDNIQYWESICKALELEPHIMRVWIDSSAEQTFEETIAAADAIIIGGGNTLNMLGIWRAQGIDQMLIEAMQRGTVVAGGSAGSISWFESGISDSRPSGLSIVEGLSILPYSNCPHYGDQAKRSLYHQMMSAGQMGAGYAMDDKAGILFRNGEVVEAVTYSPEHQAYYVNIKQGEVVAEPLPTRLLLAEGAIAEDAYSIEQISKSIKDISQPNAAIAEYLKLAKPGENTRIELLIKYKDITAIVHDVYFDLFGQYCISYTYNYDGKWHLVGEDLGATLAESEVTFREKATTILKQAQERFK